VGQSGKLLWRLKMRHPNRPNKIKDKKSSGCAMCKPHKHGWSNLFKIKEKAKRDEHDN